MATQRNGRQGNSEDAEPPAGIEHVLIPIESAPPFQSRGAPGVSINAVDEYYHRPLLKAAVEGDWELANSIFQADTNSITASITSRSETVLHIAALSAQDQFVENMVKHFSKSPRALEMVDCDGRTALHHAVLCGRIRMVKALVRSNSRLTQIPDEDKRLPFNLSTREASLHKEIAWFLAKNTTFAGPIHPDSSPHAIQGIVGLTSSGHLDIVFYLLERYPSLILKKGPRKTDKTVLGILARMPSHFCSETRLGVMETLTYKCIRVNVNHMPTDINSKDMQMATNPALQCLMSLRNITKIPGVNFIHQSITKIYDVKLRHEAAVKLVEKVCRALSEKNTTEITQFFQDRDLLVVATINGISQLVKLSIENFPELLRISDDEGTLMTLAVQYCQERILKLFLKKSSDNALTLVPAPTAAESCRMIEAAAKYNPDFDDVTNVFGAAFQLQRELQWFKAVKSWVAPNLKTKFMVASKNKRDKVGKTYWRMFMDNHKELLVDGQKWVKDTADKCMIVSTLIATVLFAATFTVPGTSNDKSEFPLKDSILVFAIFDGLGLFSSVMAILIFLAILTSRFDWLDFLDSLPKKILMGFSCLLLSLVFMLVAFVATLTFVLDKTVEWVVIPIALLASLPVMLFVALQLPLLIQVIKSANGPLAKNQDRG